MESKFQISLARLRECGASPATRKKGRGGGAGRPRKIGPEYGGQRLLSNDFKLLLERLIIERVPHVSAPEFEAASHLRICN